MSGYQPTWLRGREPLDDLIGSGLDETAAKHWLERAITDRGIVADREADPAVDLFRLPYVIQWHAKRTWRADATTIDWAAFTIVAPHAQRRLFDPTEIEVSRELLAAATTGNAAAPIAHQRYSADAELVAEAVAAINNGDFPNANRAANAFATDVRAEGTSPKQIADRLGRKIKAALGG